MEDYNAELIQSAIESKTHKKRHHHNLSKKSGMKRVENEIMAEYKREVDKIKKQKKCKIPTLKQFLDKRFKTRKHRRGVRKTVVEESKPAQEEESKPAEEESNPEQESKPTEATPVEPEGAPSEVKPEQKEETTIASALSSINPFATSEKKVGGKRKTRKGK